MNAIYTVLSAIDFENKEEIMAELHNELHRNDRVKAEKAESYNRNWDVVRESLAVANCAVTVAELWESIEGQVSSDFTKGKLSYALTHQWADNVIKMEGKVNSYRLKV